ncbi:hypothetical protein XENOCAPTIV_028733 [Xenoophorus captivus]|uniref:B30.2/SPRY domain-containing protein n=1 Tax=Xenoophorus captivus TaxID=1517983 RepID=A0ABV0RMD2_9TELE
MISERRRKIEEIKMSVVELEMAVERETSGSVCLLTMLASAIERYHAELIEVMDNSRRAAERKANAMIGQLEKDIEELEKRETALAELAQSEDHVHCVKVFLLQYWRPVRYKQSPVWCGERHLNVRDTPERFDKVVCVLGREAISSGKHYWEVSFYNVDAKVHICTFHDIFTENLFPFFSPCTNKSGKNEMPLIITRVNTTE